VLDFVESYALNKFQLIHVFTANWSQEINADLERDKKMMNEADMLIVIDDSRSNRIKLLVNWAKESQIPIIKIDVETKKSQNYTEVLKIKLVNPSDKEEVKMKINQLEMAKDNAVNSGEFEMAAIIREKIRTIINRKQ